MEVDAVQAEALQHKRYLMQEELQALLLLLHLMPLKRQPCSVEPKLDSVRVAASSVASKLDPVEVATLPKKAFWLSQDVNVSGVSA